MMQNTLNRNSKWVIFFSRVQLPVTPTFLTNQVVFTMRQCKAVAGRLTQFLCSTAAYYTNSLPLTLIMIECTYSLVGLWHCITCCRGRHSTYRKNNNHEKCAGIGLNGFISRKINKKYYITEKKKSWESFRICLLNSTSNPAQFRWKLAELAVLFSRKLLNGSQDIFFTLV